MRLTQKGEKLIDPLEQALSSIVYMLKEKDFDPSLADDTFRCAMNDYSMGIFGAPLLAILMDEAPHMSANFMSGSRHSASDLIAGRIDMVFAPRATICNVGADVHSLENLSLELLYTEELVCIGHADDAGLAKGLSLDEYLQRPHIAFSLDPNYHVSAEQAFLASHGLKQLNRIVVSSYNVMPKLVEMTGHLALIPMRLARKIEKTHAIQMVKPPIDLSVFEVMMITHKRDDQRPAMRWFKDALLRCAEAEQSAISGYFPASLPLAA